MRGLHRVTGWRWVTLGAFVAAGALFATSALNSHGVDLRASSVTDLTTVLLRQRSEVDSAQAQVAALNARVTALGKEVGDKRTHRLQRQVAALRGPAGFSAVEGPGVTVTLNDAPKHELDSAVASGQVSADELVVHQQDIQAVVNTLWLGGAQGVTVQGQRVISTTGIKCVGNTVVLHGVPYSPPYVISAVGDPAGLTAGLDASAYIQAYLTIAHRYQLGWKLSDDADLKLPAYVGTADLRYARLDTSVKR
jgi:uncharacterized protein YlxW (UPF0749 family)